MKIEFYDKTTGEILNDKGWYYVDEDGIVYERYYDMERASSNIGWRVVE